MLSPSPFDAVDFADFADFHDFAVDDVLGFGDLVGSVHFDDFHHFDPLDPLERGL